MSGNIVRGDGVGFGLRVALLSCALSMPGAVPGRAANWLDRLPSDDPGLTAGRPAAAQPEAASTAQASVSPTTAPASRPDAAAAAQAQAGQASGGLFSSVYNAAAAVVALPGRVGQGLWEFSYMFGFNRTPPHRPVVVDVVPDLDPSSEPAPAAPPASRVVPAAVAAAKPVGVTPAPARAVTPASVPGSGTPASATNGDDEIDPGLLANFVYDRGERRPDGSFFVPKTLQRLFKVRTVRTAVAEVPVTLNLPGRIVPNAHTHGRVEASQLGRFEPPEAGLPVLGDKVVKGQLLGWVSPAVGVVDRSQTRREVARLTTDIRVQTENLEIIKSFSWVPFRDGKIYQAEQTLAGLRREREALLPMLQTREPLRAPTTGVISVTDAVAGKVINPGDLVFEIVDPEDLWVEAVAPDPATAADASRVQSASALTPEQQVLQLSFVGSGLALKQQATPILFSIESPPPGLRVGRPVTVTVRSDVRSRRGLPVSREAVTIGTDGVEEVWEQTAPEVFLPHPVRTQDIDGATVLVVDGLAEGARVVVRGSKLMAQLQ
jgi:hypothetical protein